MKMSDVFKSLYLKGTDIPHAGLTLVIDQLRKCLLPVKDGKPGEMEEKPLLCFVGRGEGLLLNVTNWRRVVAATGEDDSDKWPGKKITLIAEEIEAFGETHRVIRVKVPSKKIRR